MPIFESYNDEYNYNILNNYIGYDSSLYCELLEYGYFKNNIIGNNNDISIERINLCEDLIIYNNVKLEYDSASNTNYNNVIINSSNNIIFKNIESLTDNIIYINNLNINSSNNITLLYNNVSNVTILNNCDGSINLSDNIIVDNYISTDTLSTSPNSVYLFGQDVYAKSFNTLK